MATISKKIVEPGKGSISITRSKASFDDITSGIMLKPSFVDVIVFTIHVF